MHDSESWIYDSVPSGHMTQSDPIAKFASSYAILLGLKVILWNA